MVFFAIFYGAVSYSLPLLMMQSFTEASAEATRRVVALNPCLLYTSDAADDMQCVDLGGRRIIKKKKRA